MQLGGTVESRSSPRKRGPVYCAIQCYDARTELFDSLDLLLVDNFSKRLLQLKNSHPSLLSRPLPEPISTASQHSLTKIVRFDSLAKMSTVIPYFIYTIRIIANSIILTLSMMASTAIPLLLFDRLGSISSTSRQPLFISTTTPELGRRSIRFTYSKVVFPTIMLSTSTGYVGGVYYFWVFQRPIIEAVVKSTVTIVGIGVGLAAIATIVVGFGRIVGRAP